MDDTQQFKTLQSMAFLEPIICTPKPIYTFKYCKNIRHVFIDIFTESFIIIQEQTLSFDMFFRSI